jgi:hypothetical protein
VGVLVETGEFLRGFFGAAEHHLGQHDLVDKAGGQGGFTKERFGQPGRLLVCRSRQPQLHDLQGRVGNGHADRNFVGLDVVRVGGHPMVTGRQQEGPHRDGMAGAGHHHRLRVGQEPIRQLEAASEHVDRRLHLA